MPQTEDKPLVPLHQIFRVFFFIGATSFGGGLIGLIHRETVTIRKWLREDQFLSGLALGQVLPGANVSNMAVYIGQLLRGWVGAGIALIAVLTGPFFMVIAFVSTYDSLIRIPGFHSAMDGIAAAAVGAQQSADGGRRRRRRAARMHGRVWSDALAIRSR